MKNVLILTILAVFILGAVPAFAETVTSSNERHGQHTVTVHDPAIFDKESEWKIKGAVKYEDIVRITDNLRLDAEVMKQVNDTSFEEGWEGKVTLVYSKNFIDFRSFWPFGKK